MIRIVYAAKLSCFPHVEFPIMKANHFQVSANPNHC